MKQCVALLLSMILLVLCSGCPGSGSSFNAKAKITIKVVDENNNPLKGIDVGITFPRIFYGKEKSKTEHKLTDIDGRCSASGTSYDTVRYGVIKEGYYNTINSYKFKQKNSGTWLPNNPEVTIVLRKIENPVPMYACQLRPITLPDANKKIGFDLIEYDWVSPYGKGNHADFIFRLEGKYNNEYEYDNTLTLTFANKYDGIQLITEDRKFGSQFKLPRFAPETGYQNILTKSISRTPGQPYKSDSKEDNNYIFRIRSEEKNGKLLRAMYGKIQGDMNFGVDRTRKISITFTPFLNPDYSRNLEFDPKQDLYRDLESFEHVGL